MLFRQGQRSGQIDRSRGLSDAALLIGDSDDAAHFLWLMP
jgi:hypothetical protein